MDQAHLCMVPELELTNERKLVAYADGGELPDSNIVV